VDSWNLLEGCHLRAGALYFRRQSEIISRDGNVGFDRSRGIRPGPDVSRLAGGPHSGAWSVFPLLVPVAIFGKIRKEFAGDGVDLEVVLGALCAYLYIGAYFAFVYDAIAILSTSPFFA
jgi:hypothetical protein